MRPITSKILVWNPDYFESQNILSQQDLLCVLMDFPFDCNYACLKCYRKKDIHFDKMYVQERMKKISEAAELGAKVLYIPGEGEPLYHFEEIKTLISHWNSLWMITTLYSNGSLLTEDVSQFLFDNNVSVIVSIDSIVPQTYEYLTGGGDINLVKQNITKAKEIFSQDAKVVDGKMHSRLWVITIVTNQNKDEIGEVKERCWDKVFYICNFPIKKGGAEDNRDDLVWNNFEELKTISHKYTDTWYAGLSAPLKDGRCVALHNGITIDTDGNVLVCPASVNKSVGNIKDASLWDLHKKIHEFTSACWSPKCIARDIDESVFKHHDGNILLHL